MQYYKILGYICFFRIGELGIEKYEEILRSLDGTKIVPYLQFLTKELKSSCYENWCTVYDREYIEVTEE